MGDKAKKTGRGGRRAGAGRPVTRPGAKRKQVYLTDETLALAAEIGNGSASVGIEIAVAAYRKPAATTPVSSE